MRKNEDFMQFKNAFLILACFAVSCGTKDKSHENRPEIGETETLLSTDRDTYKEPTIDQPNTHDSAPNDSLEPPFAAHAFEDLTAHKKLPNSAIKPECMIPGDDGDCLAYRLVKAYFATESDRKSNGHGTLKRTCEQPEGDAPQDCQYFRLERIARQ